MNDEIIVFFSRLKAMRFLTLILIKSFKFIEKIISNLKFYALTNEKKRVICHWSTEIKYPQNIIFGERVIIGPNCTIGAKSKIKIGNNVRLSKGVIIETAGLDYTQSIPYPHVSRPINIGNNVWLGTNSIILGGVSIGDNSIIAAGSIVVDDVPCNSIVAGSKAKVIKKIR